MPEGMLRIESTDPATGAHIADYVYRESIPEPPAEQGSLLPDFLRFFGKVPTAPVQDAQVKPLIPGRPQ
jgi:hypothetical protein